MKKRAGGMGVPPTLSLVEEVVDIVVVVAVVVVVGHLPPRMAQPLANPLYHLGWVTHFLSYTYLLKRDGDGVRVGVRDRVRVGGHFLLLPLLSFCYCFANGKSIPRQILGLKKGFFFGG